MENFIIQAKTLPLGSIFFFMWNSKRTNQILFLEPFFLLVLALAVLQPKCFHLVLVCWCLLHHVHNL
jgi:hypothetical protein